MKRGKSVKKKIKQILIFMYSCLIEGFSHTTFLCAFVGLVVGFLYALYVKEEMNISLLSVIIITVSFAIIFAFIEFVTRTDSFSVREENEEDDICTKDNSLNSTSDIIPFARTLLRKYENETDLEEAEILWERFWIVEEKKIPLPHTFQTQELPILTNALQTFFDLPDEVSEDLQRSLEKNINEMIIPLLRETQDLLDSHYEQKRLEVEIDSEVVQALHPKDPFRTDPVEIAKRTNQEKSAKRTTTAREIGYICGSALNK